MSEDNKNNGKIRQSFSNGRSKVVTVEVKKKRSFGDFKNRSNSSQSFTNAFVQKSGLTNDELQNRIKAVQELAATHKLEAQKREAEANNIVSSRLTELEAQKLVASSQNVSENEISNSNKEVVKVDNDVNRVSEKVEKKVDIISDRKSNNSMRTDGLKAKFNERKTAEGRDAYVPNKRKFEKGNAQSQDRQSVSRGKNFVRDNNAIANSYMRAAADAYATSQVAENNKFAMKGKQDKNKSLDDRNQSENSKKNKNTGFERNFDRGGKISIYNALDENDDDDFRGNRKSKTKKSQNKHITTDDSVKIIKEVQLPETISVQELANRMAVRSGELIKSLMKMGVMATINQTLDADTAELVVLELGHKVKRVDNSAIEQELLMSDESAREADIVTRAPIVTVMGHVDHGKTSLLDALRKTDIALSEAGGITQHIGAYQITLQDNRKITFIDTPGHAAFTEMRARGANVTDVVVLVVAADDGVKEQTVEAINHAKAANVPMIIAINKIDKVGADPNRVRNELLNYEIVVESLGGDVIDVEVSAKSGINLDKLEESILFQAEFLELKADQNKNAKAVVVESKVEKGLGPVATILVQDGTLKLGDVFVCGTSYGKVRAIKNDLKMNLQELQPGAPGEIIGFNITPVPGDDFIVISSEQKAKEIADMRAVKKKEKEWLQKSKMSFVDVFAQAKNSTKMSVLPVIVKGDVQGSVEAISESLKKLATDEVSVNILHSGIGGITESDVILANASNALILGFNVRANLQARELSLTHGIELKYYSVIYDLIDDVKSILSGMLSPILSEKVIGTAEIRQIFEISSVGKVAGCMVTHGIIKRAAKVRVLRDNVVIHTGNVKSIYRKKDEAKEVKEGFECGVCLESYGDIHLNDVLEFFEIEKTARSL